VSGKSALLLHAAEDHIPHGVVDTTVRAREAMTGPHRRELAAHIALIAKKQMSSPSQHG
jgi:hypothetical protein